MTEEQIDAHALLEELREMLETNANVDWSVADAADEFKTLLEYVDRRRPVTEVQVGIQMDKGRICEVRASKTKFPIWGIFRDEPYNEGIVDGWLQFKVVLEE